LTARPSRAYTRPSADARDVLGVGVPDLRPGELANDIKARTGRAPSGRPPDGDNHDEEQAPVPKRTYQPKRIPRLKEHGFMKRMATRSGRAVLAARRKKGRHALTVSNEGKFTQNK